MKKILLAGALLSILLPETALCAKKNRAASDTRVDKFFRQHDRDHNGTIERGEFPGKEKRFGRIDSNHDGKLSKAELDAAAPHRTRRAVKGK
jgi:Ca2+-binding EF-hand superfamily protein